MLGPRAALVLRSHPRKALAFRGDFWMEGDTVSETPSTVATDHMLRRVRGEYLEMPGLRLTRRQAQRLWGLDEQTCARLLDSLTEANFLHRTDDGTYGRLTEGAVAASPARMAGSAGTRLPDAGTARFTGGFR
jgi:hypothetical protein